MTLCDLTFRCDKKWDELAQIRASSARYCDDCKKAVFMVKSRPELSVASALRRCVGIADMSGVIGDIGDPGAPGTMDWMEAGYLVHVSASLTKVLSAERIRELRLLFPKLFDTSANEQALLAGVSVPLGELGPEEREFLTQEFQRLAPELAAHSEA